MGGNSNIAPTAVENGSTKKAFKLYDSYRPKRLRQDFIRLRLHKPSHFKGGARTSPSKPNYKMVLTNPKGESYSIIFNMVSVKSPRHPIPRHRRRKAIASTPKRVRTQMEELNDAMLTFGLA